MPPLPPTPRGRPERGFGHYLRDVVYGASDGVVTTFAIAAGATGAGLAPAVVLVLGGANLVADGLSMGASNYLGLKAELRQTGASSAIERPARHGLATIVAFAVAGSVPLAAYLLPLGARAFAGAALLGLLTLAGIGMVRSRVVGERPLVSVSGVVLVGGAAALAAFAIGSIAQRVVGSGMAG